MLYVLVMGKVHVELDKKEFSSSRHESSRHSYRLRFPQHYFSTFSQAFRFQTINFLVQSEVQLYRFINKLVQQNAFR